MFFRFPGFMLLIVCMQLQAQSRLITHRFESEVFGNSRLLRVYLPPAYHASPEQHYPVLYLNDGQDLFGETTAVRPFWEAGRKADSLIRAGVVAPLLMVGIDHAGTRQRANEYLPWEDPYLHPPLPDPQGRRYPDFLLREVMPFIEAQYRVKSGAAYTGLGGASYGALIALYTVLQRPGAFGFLLLESPSLYVQQQAMLELAREAAGPFPGRVYAGIGTNEMGLDSCHAAHPDNRMAVADVTSLQAILQEKGVEEMRIIVDSCAVHGVRSWARRFPEALRFVAGGEP